MTHVGGIKRKWSSLSVRFKIGIFVGTVVATGSAICLFPLGVLYFYVRDFNGILGDSYLVNQALVHFEAENAAFIACSQSMGDESVALYQQARQRARESISRLKPDYRNTGLQRYLLTQAVQTAYGSYSGECNRLISANVKDTIYANQYYDTLDIALYIGRYLQALMKETLDEGNSSYTRKMETLRLLPPVGAALPFFLLALAFLLGSVIMRQIISPVLQMAESAGEIAENRLDGPDIRAENRDEIGRLVRMFNRMKRSMREYIAALQEVNLMESRLHQEELQKVEMARQLKTMQLAMLQSQINPHFLFNTLNTVRSSARLEGARFTEEIVQRLANLFRYNLQTSDAAVPLERELNIVQDYIYIQKRRFGSRLNFILDSQVDGNEALVPVFTLQPLVENAVIHAISPREEGGTVRVKIRSRGGCIRISVTDDGPGIPRDKLTEMLNHTSGQKGHLSHIGIGNVRSRLEMLFEDSRFAIYSRPGRGTSVRLLLPAPAQCAYKPKETGFFVQHCDRR